MYSTYLGGNNTDEVWAIAADAAGNAYVGLQAVSANYPVTPGVVQATKGAFADAAVTKLNPTGTALIFSTFLGGGAIDIAWGIAIDASDNVYVTGNTQSNNFPVLNPLQSFGGALDAFVTVLNPSGTAYIFSSYLGGSAAESALGIAVDGAGNIYASGHTASLDFPTVASLQATHGGATHDTYVAKVSTGPPSAGVTLTQSGGSTNVTEGGATDTYTVVLNTAPTANVTITINPGTQVTVAPATLTFTPANWNTAQTVTVTAVDDAAVEGPHTGTITHTAASTDTAYNAITIAGVTANITDNDGAAAGVTVTQSGGSTAVTEGGATDTFTIVLNTAPTANVAVATNGGTQLTTAPTSMTFTPTNWNVPQTVTVTAIDDAAVEGTHSGFVGIGVASTDPAYNTVTVPAITVSITDNDSGGGAGVTVTESGASTNVAEGGATDTYTVVLNTAPTANVTVTINAGTQVTAAPPTLTFTPASWNTAQTVTVTAVDDALVEGAHASTITHTSASSDTAYNGIVIVSVTVNITDNDGPPVPPPTPGAGLEGSFGGGTALSGPEGSFLGASRSRRATLQGPLDTTPGRQVVVNVSHR
jgi:hypothetical protein